MKASEIAAMIDHSLLRPEMTLEDVRAGCALAKEYGTASVCVRPCDVSEAAAILKGSPVKVGTVIGFPHGANNVTVKVLECVEAMRDGAVELDVVMNYGKLLSGDAGYVRDEIRIIAECAHKGGAIVKVILENCFLTEDLIAEACGICEDAGADFVKTSTGFGSGGATLADLALMRRSCSGKVRIKAAGGVRTLDAALDVIKAGCSRFGATATKAIVEEARAREGDGTP
ncbi:MAG: deoxyribose-phosphate aldolase [Oscillospiraceae bacterium]|nr:deoxyribose-phosphate aldolase [Oscillospiraceae bacterium]